MELVLFLIVAWIAGAIAIKIIVFLWKNVFVPTCRVIGTLIVGASILAFFVFLYVFRDVIEDFIAREFGEEAKWLLIVVAGLWAGIKYLRSR